MVEAIIFNSYGRRKQLQIILKENNQFC